MNKEELSLAMEKIKDVSDRLTANQTKAIERLVEKTDKRIETKINDACKRLTERTISEIKERLEIVNNSEKVAEDIKNLNASQRTS